MDTRWIDLPFLPNEIGELAVYWPFNLFFGICIGLMLLCIAPFYYGFTGMGKLRNKIIQAKNNKIGAKSKQPSNNSLPTKNWFLPSADEKDTSLREAEKEVEEYLQEDKFANVK